MGSPPIERGILILDFLTTHPGRGFTAAELSRRLGISRSTAHSILITMADRALVLRNPDTHEYRLGPALVDAERGRYRAARSTARRQGYGVGVRVPALDEISRLQASEAADTPAGRREIGRARTALAYDHALLPIGEALPGDAEISSIA